MRADPKCLVVEWQHLAALTHRIEELKALVEVMAREVAHEQAKYRNLVRSLNCRSYRIQDSP